MFLILCRENSNFRLLLQTDLENLILSYEFTNLLELLGILAFGELPLVRYFEKKSNNNNACFKNLIILSNGKYWDKHHLAYSLKYK